MRIAAVSDVHYHKQAQGKLRGAFAQASREADVLLLCGDLTNHGRAEEAEVLAEDLTRAVEIPMIGVLGNHDFESGSPETVVDIMCEAGVTILDGESTVVDGVGFAGAVGFAGGFGEYALSAWGEPEIKGFVQKAVEEELKLERALSELDMEQRIVLLHYAPIASTVEGEPLAIYPFLGSSRLERPLDAFHVTAAFHGHAHAGSPEGETAGGFPVYNVSVPVLQRATPDAPAFRLFEVPVGESV